MRTLGGHILTPDGPTEGTVHVDDSGRVSAVDPGPPEGPVELEGLVLPAPTNAHTHIGDRLAREHAPDPAEASIEELFAPPDGVKHRILADASDQALTRGMRTALLEADEAGNATLWDFRENGPSGARLARRATQGSPVELVLLGRPTTPDRWGVEARELESLVDGIGISGLEDQPFELSQAQADWCRAHGKHLALHLSEARREDVEQALSLDPDLLVHCTQVSPEDIREIADAGVSVVLCPRSNALFGNQPPVDALLEAGVELALGTDNAMFHVPDVLAEAAYLSTHWPAVPATDVLRMTVGSALPGPQPAAIREGQRVIVLDDDDGLDAAIRQRRVTIPWREHIARRNA